MMRKLILHSVHEAIVAVQKLSDEEALLFMEKAAKMLRDCYEQDGKVIIAGNGGSLCDAIHFAEELTGQFRTQRKALPAMALADPGHMSCVGNDMGFDKIFSRAIEAHGKENDLFISLTTSGNSKNLLVALEEAKKRKMKTIAFLGKTGGKMKGLADLEWIVSGFPFSDRIQEAHMAAIHIIIEMTERLLFATSPYLSSV